MRSSETKGSTGASAVVRDAAEQATQLAKVQAAQAALLARSAAVKAGPIARGAAEKAAPKVGAAVDWASPRLERGLLAAGPAVEAAAEKVAPAVDAARDRIVDDLLPRLVEAVSAAAVASATAQRAAAEKVSASLENAATAVVAPQPRPRRGRRLLLFGTLAAGSAAGLAAWRRSRASGPEWDSLDADGPAFTGGPEPTPSTLTESTSSASAAVAESVTEEPIADGLPETTHGDPVLDGLGTAEISGADTAGASSTDVVTDVVTDADVVDPGDGASDVLEEGSAPTLTEGTGPTVAEGTTEAPKPSPRRRKQ